MLRSQRSLKQKITRIQVLTTFFVLLITSTVLLYNHYNSLKESILNTEKSIARVLGLNLSSSLLFSDSEASHDVLNALQNESNIIYALVEDLYGNHFAFYYASDKKIELNHLVISDATHYKFFEDHLVVAQKIYHNDDYLGKLTIISRLDELNEALKRSLIIFVILLIGAILVALLFTHVASKPLLQRIESLVDATYEISRGKLEQKVKEEGGDEISTLAKSFNQMTEKLRSSMVSKSYVDNIIQTMGDVLIVCKHDLRIKTVNNAFTSLLGYQAHEIEGTFLDEIIERSDGAEKLIENQNFNQMEVELLSKDGRRAKGLMSGAYMSGTNNESETQIDIVLVAQDITEIKNAQFKIEGLLEQAENRAEILAETEVELKKTNEELRNFIYIMSHDLKAPLRAIGSVIDWLINDHSDSINDEGRELMNVIKGRSTRMYELIDGIINYARLGNARSEFTMIDVSALVLEVVDFMGKPDHITIKIAEGIPDYFGIHMELRQIFQNLIDNAIKFIDKKEGKIEITFEENSEEVVFHITDNGAGMEEKNYQKIFEVFQTLQPRDEIEGTGIGLSIVKKIVHKMKGRIWLKSIKGEGTTFSVALPINKKDIS